MVLSRRGGIAFLKDHSATLDSGATDQSGRWRNGGLDTATGGGDAEAGADGIAVEEVEPAGLGVALNLGREVGKEGGCEPVMAPGFLT